MFPLFRAIFRQVLQRPPAPIRVVALLLAVLCYGASGFLNFELAAKPDLSWGDGLWWSLVTITTIGYGDYFPTSAGGRFLVALPLMLFGIGLLGYVLSLAASALVESKTREIRGMSSMKHLDHHLIIINVPNQALIERLIGELCRENALGRNTEVVIVDEELSELPSSLVLPHIHFVRGNPARDETLVRAGLEQAAQVVVLSKRPGDLASDHQSVAITLAIEARPHRGTVVVECVDMETQELLHKAGCDSVVCLSRFDAQFIANEALNPGAQEVLDELMSTTGGDQLFYTRVTEKLAGSFRQVSDFCRQQRHQAIGIRRDKSNRFQLDDGSPIEVGDLLISIGPQKLRLGG
jgi:voltage-gated potassium channel